MAWIDINNGDYGWVGKLRLVEDGVPVDLSPFTTLQMILRSPSGVSATKTATFDTNGVNGVLRYVVALGDIDAPGQWYVQARVSRTGAQITSEMHAFTVAERL